MIFHGPVETSPFVSCFAVRVTSCWSAASSMAKVPELIFIRRALRSWRVKTVSNRFKTANWNNNWTKTGPNWLGLTSKNMHQAPDWTYGFGWCDLFFLLFSAGLVWLMTEAVVKWSSTTTNVKYNEVMSHHVISETPTRWVKTGCWGRDAHQLGHICVEDQRRHPKPFLASDCD